MKTILSPNTVIAKYISDTIDILRPRIETKKYQEVVFYVGTNINGVPHIGTSLVQAIAFTFAKKMSEKFNMPCSIFIGIHDNISFESKIDENNYTYHKTYFHSLGSEKIRSLIDAYYKDYLDTVSNLTGISYSIETYSASQTNSNFRKSFLDTLSFGREIGWCVSPSNGNLQVRTPCPVCHFSDRDAKLSACEYTSSAAIIKSVCLEHGKYESEISIENDTYIDLSTLYRNIVKELNIMQDRNKLFVVVKGGDWIYSTATMDLAYGLMGYTIDQTPARIFTPQITTSTGAKLSKSLISSGDSSVQSIPNWLLDMTEFKTHFGDLYIQKILDLVDLLFKDPRNMYRTYTCEEISRLLN